MFKDIKEELKKYNPLIHAITNPISIRDCANVILSTGARPMMAEHPEEVETITKSAGALLINLGNLTKAREEAMLISAKAAKENNIPYVIDLCGIASLSNRRDLALKLISICEPGIIKGNYSEIKALYDEAYKGSGVDSDKNLTTEEIAEISKALSEHYKTTILASGKTDVIANGTDVYLCNNGSAQMATITGTGCMQGALCTAYLSVTDSVDAATTACQVFGIAGEMAETPLGSGIFAVNLLDRLSTITESDVERLGKLEKY